MKIQLEITLNKKVMKELVITTIEEMAKQAMTKKERHSFAA